MFFKFSDIFYFIFNITLTALGFRIDGETGAQPTAQADGDDLNG